MDTLRAFARDNAIAVSVASIGSLLTVCTYAAARRYFAGGVCRSRRSLAGKTVVVTGANTGIGKEAAADFARRGARVILACPDLGRGQRAAADIRGEVVVRRLDLASLRSVREFAAEVERDESRVDVLVNNAGVMACPPMTTADGFEMQFGVNHLGHFLLTMLLLDRLKESAPARVVHVASTAYRFKAVTVDFDDLMWERREYEPFRAYGQSKVANVLFSRELARRLEGSGVTSNALHPGVIRTELGRHFVPGLAWWKRLLLPAVSRLFMKSPWEGAQTTIHCAVCEEVDGVSGKFFGDCRMEPLTTDLANDDEVARRLFDVSRKLVGLTD